PGRAPRRPHRGGRAESYRQGGDRAESREADTEGGRLRRETPEGGIRKERSSAPFALTHVRGTHCAPRRPCPRMTGECRPLLFGILHPIYQHCSTRQAKHLDRYAAQQQARQARAAMATDEDEIAAVVGGGLYDAVGHVEAGHGLRRSRDTRRGGAIEHRLEILLRLLGGRLFVVYVGDGIGRRHAVEAHRGGERLSHVQGHHFSADLTRQAYALVGRLRRERRTIGGDEYLLEHCGSRG